MVVHLFLNNNKALDFLPINSIKNGGITGAQAALQHLSKQLQNAPIDEQTRQQLQYIISHQLQQLLAGQVRLEAFIQDDTQVAAVI